MPGLSLSPAASDAEGRTCRFSGDCSVGTLSFWGSLQLAGALHGDALPRLWFVCRVAQSHGTGGKMLGFSVLFAYFPR